MSYMCPGHDVLTTPSEILCIKVRGVWLGIIEGAIIIMSK